MKILIIRTFPSILDPNGYNIQEIGFAKALVRSGVSCDVVLYNGKNGDKEEVIDVHEDGKTVGQIKVFLRHGYGILKNGFFPGLSKIVKDYDILQVHEYDQISSWRFYAWYRKKPVVIYHGPYFDDYNKGYNLKCRIFDNTFLRLKHRKDTLCFTKSKAAAAFLESKGFKHTCPIGVGLDIQNFDSGARTADTVAVEEGFNVIYVGKIEPRRNSMMLLDVIDKVAAQNCSIRFTVVGDGEAEYTSVWLQKAKPLIDAGVLNYSQKKTQAELKELYSQMDLMVFPSNYEIFGMVLLEAMYFDLPVLSSDNGGSDTLITNDFDGLILKDFDIENWAERIISIAQDTAKYQMLKNNLKAKDHQVYTWDGIARVYLKEIDSLLSGS